MKTTFISLLGYSLLLIGGNGLSAQNGSVSAGGEAFGASGLMYYSIGQVDYTALSGSTGNINAGLQQPYDISTVTGIGETKNDLNISLYPNPASDFISLILEAKALKNAGYVLEDISGKLLSVEKISDAQTSIPLSGLPAGVYLLKIVSGGAFIKAFKIIKNQ